LCRKYTAISAAKKFSNFIASKIKLSKICKACAYFLLIQKVQAKTKTTVCIIDCFRKTSDQIQLMPSKEMSGFGIKMSIK